MRIQNDMRRESANIKKRNLKFRFLLHFNMLKGKFFMVIFYPFDPGSENNKKDFVSQVTKVATCDIES